MVCGLDVSLLLEEGGVVPTAAMQAEVALQRGLLGLEEEELVDDDRLEDPANRGWFNDRDVSAALNIRRCAVGPRPTELCYWEGRLDMPKPGQPG
ncbi:hypothetical protein QJQ45_004375 [Haematococcus lacustris]|nr:hypothetical protein QJQ45_004375 [Haematococcus lacustris]